MTRARWLAVIALLVAAAFAYWGGQYSAPNYRALKRDERAAESQVARLQREVDSLRLFRDSLATNPVVQERVARERFGMVRPGELSFTVSPDSAPATAPAKRRP